MRICLIGEYSAVTDEARRVTSIRLIAQLRNWHQVLPLNIVDYATLSFWRKVKAFNPDIIHYIPGMSIKSLILMRMISVYCRSAKTVISAMRPLISSRFTRFLPLLKPDLILTQSQETEDRLKSLGCNCEFLPSGVDTNLFSPVGSERKRELRQKYGLDSERFIILHVGSIKPHRGVCRLIQLQSDGAQVLVVGPTSVGIDSKTQSQLEASGCLVWTDYFKDIDEIYALADCYVYPTTSIKDDRGRNIADSVEMPLSVLEAMACNIPVIATRFGALPRVFREGGGFIFARPEEFAHCLEQIRNNSLEVKTRQMVLPYSWDSIGQQLNNTYQLMLERRKFKSRSRFICFTGIDGAGKTTLAKATVAALGEQGIKSYYVHSRLNPFISKPAMLVGMALFLRKKKKHQDYRQYTNSKRKFFQNRLLATVYRSILFFDFFWQVLFKIRIPLMLGRNVICDRYVYDTVILDLAIDLNLSLDKTASVMRGWLRFLPKPDLVFLVDIPEEVAFSRKDDISVLDSLVEARSLFLKEAKTFNLVVLDNSRPLGEVKKEALNRMSVILSVTGSSL